MNTANPQTSKDAEKKEIIMTGELSHPELPVSAAPVYWKALAERHSGVRVNYLNREHSLSVDAFHGSSLDGLLIQAIEETGDHGRGAIAWVLREISRRSEERERTEASKQEAAAISALADAIKTEQAQAVLGKLLAKLTPRTQYAVKMQLNSQEQP